MIQDIAIRPARVEDAEGLAALARAIAEDPDGYGPGQPDEMRSPEEQRKLLEEICADERVMLLIAERGGSELVGEVSLRLFSRFRSTSHVRVLGITLAPSVRGRGLGRRMMSAAIDWARDRGVRRIELSVFSNNARAMALYRKMGFEVEGIRRRVFALGGSDVDDVVMALML